MALDFGESEEGSERELPPPPPDWLPLHDFTGEAAQALEGLVSLIEMSGLGLEGPFSPESLGVPPHGELAKATKVLRSELVEGAGLAVVRGIEWPDNVPLCRTALLLFSAVLGCSIVPQSADLKEVVADVKVPDASEGIHTAYRGYRNAQAQMPHCDSICPGSCDVVAMLCRTPASDGGDSLFVPAEAVHQTISEESPELYQRLCAKWPWRHEKEWLDAWGRQEVLDDGLPILSRSSSGKLHCQAQFGKILRLNVEAGLGPAMAIEDGQALDLMEDVLGREALQKRWRLAAGDLLLINNWVWLHGRTAFAENPGEGAAKRHMLRVWMRW